MTCCLPQTQSYFSYKSPVSTKTLLIKSNTTTLGKSRWDLERDLIYWRQTEENCSVNIFQIIRSNQACFNYGILGPRLLLLLLAKKGLSYNTKYSHIYCLMLVIFPLLKTEGQITLYNSWGLKAFSCSLSALENLETKLIIGQAPLLFYYLSIHGLQYTARKEGFAFGWLKKLKIQLLLEPNVIRNMQKIKHKNIWKILWKPGKIMKFCHKTLVGTLQKLHMWIQIWRCNVGDEK